MHYASDRATFLSSKQLMRATPEKLFPSVFIETICCSIFAAGCWEIFHVLLLTLYLYIPSALSQLPFPTQKIVIIVLGNICSLVQPNILLLLMQSVSLSTHYFLTCFKTFGF